MRWPTARATCSRPSSCRRRSAGSSSARKWGERWACASIFVERQDGKLVLRRGFTLDASDRVLVVEDVITTGLSTRETIAVAEGFGALVTGAAAIIDRGSDPARLNLPMQALVRLEVPTYAPEDCPLCAKGIPVVKPGSRAS